MYSKVRAAALTFAAVALAFSSVQPAQAVAPIGSSQLLKQTQTQNLPGIDGANASQGSRWLPNTVVLNDRIYYIASTDATGAELFTSDGTAAGTYVVKESTVGPSSSLYVYNTKLTVSNGKIYYWGPGYEVYVSDGTAAGTGMLKKLSTRMTAQPTQFTKVGTKTFFVAYDSSLYYNDYTATSQGYAGQELWVTDGTSAGTSLVKDIYPGNYLSSGNYYNNNSGISNITECNGVAFFTANDGVNGYELWTSDGTNAGTYLVKDINAGVSNSSPSNMSCVNNKVVFNAYTSAAGQEPWVSDGTSAGTFQLKDIYVGATSSAPVSMYAFNGKAYFNAQDSTNGYELWSTDGTSSGTTLVKNINPGTANSSPSNFMAMGGKLYFSASDSRGTELWSTDGTTVGTLFVADINQTAPGASSSPKDMYVWNGKLYFSADNGSIGREPWVTDGTNSGTRLVRDMFPGISDMLDQSNTTTNVPFFAGTSAGLFFTANSPIYSQEMWITDGTDAGTRIVVDAKSGPGYSYAKDGVAFNGRIYFAASSAYYGQELWSTDLAGNTQQLIDIYPGAASGLRTDLAHNMVVYNNRLYFTARNATNGYELWSTDGTAAGTSQAFDLNANNSGTSSASYNGPRYMTVCNGKLYMNWSTAGDYELYVSDGTLAGTTLVKNLSSMTSSDPQQIVCFNNTVYFNADDSYYWQSATNTVGRELYKTDGTSAGTVLMTDLNTSAMALGSGAGTNSSYPSNLTVVGNFLYFSATNTSNEVELYYTDGTTVTKIDVYAGAGSSSPANFVKYNGLLYFTGTTAATGRDMLRLDPTTQAITAIDVNAGSSSFTYLQPVVMGGLMWFQSSGEMWSSDGTAANTGQFEDLLPGGNSNPDWLFSLGGVVMYITYDSSLGSQPRFIVGNAIYTVSFNGNGSSSGTAPADVSVMSVSASVPGNTGNLVRTNYRFVGWNTSPTGVGTNYLPGETITPIVDTPLFAQWATNTTYTVTYDANGATGGVAAPAVGNVDTPIYLDSNSGNLTKPGYTFGGWNTLANGTGTTYAAGYRYTATANVTLYAKWTALPTFTISFNGNGNTGGAAPASLTGVYSTATLPGVGTMVKAGFVFAGWNTAADGLGSAYAAGETLTPQATTTLYAQWTANPTYTLTYDANGATSGSVPAVATASSTYVVIDNNTGALFKTGYIFSGWNTAADGTGTSYTGGNNFLLNANTTFYAKWVAANYTVTYSGNGNTGGTAPAAATGVSVSTVTPTNSGSLVKAGYTFVGWNTLASGLGTDYAVGSTYSPTSSTTLYAKWTALPTYTITYNGNGNTGGGVPVAQSGIYSAVNLDTNSGALVKSGAYFSGWNTQADGLGTHYAAGASFTPSANITLYAEWSANPTFTLTYDGNSKTGGVTPVPQTGISSTATVLGNTGSLVRLGYRFDGWNTLANGTGTTY
ncbi:MAG: InlB B-repeat-containing protein, partial [Actinomycetales bacterium]|nr:InlB B-repeat-containing protein [Actinomycetales bacterium]